MLDVLGCGRDLRVRFYRAGWHRRYWAPIFRDALVSSAQHPIVRSQAARINAGALLILVCSGTLAPRIDNALRRWSAQWNACVHSNKRLILFDSHRCVSFRAPKSRHHFWAVEPLLLWGALRGNIPPRTADDSLTMSSECEHSRTHNEETIDSKIINFA